MSAPPHPAEPALDAAGLVHLWEAGETDALPRRAVLMLTHAWPGHDWLRAPIGTRDRWLFHLREHLFGAAMPATVACPACDTKLELELRTTDLLAPSPPATDTLSVTDGHVTVYYRLPHTLDLLAVATADDRAERLLARCVTGAESDGAPIDAAALSPALRTAIAAGMAAADPQADAQLGLSCPGCGQEWTAPFDIAGYLWDDIADCARRLLRQVHDIARAYGWAEDAILALPARRRRWYVETITGGAA